MDRIKSLKKLVKTSWIGLPLLAAYRLYIALSFSFKPFLEIPGWLVRSREFSNFTSDLNDLDEKYLASFVSVITGRQLGQIESYIRELKENADLKAHIARGTSASKYRYISDPEARYGCRIGWYAFVRALKPKVVVETGVDKGLGTCVIAEALRRNTLEGFPGTVIGLDIMPEAGFLFTEPYSSYGRIVFGSSLDSLKSLPKGIDIILHDSDHRAEYESAEYEAAADKLSDDALILSDNSQCTASLFEFARATGRQFLFCNGEPKCHWYRGYGIGAAFRRGKDSVH
jgi:predicted O-methyltransferase YrrM